VKDGVAVRLGLVERIEAEAHPGVRVPFIIRKR
jgi:hypothetical protein